MQTRLAALAMMALLAFAPSAFGSGKKGNSAIITLHMETESTDNPKMTFQQQANGKMRWFHRMPEMSANDIQAFSPFPDESGDYGLVIQFKPSVANRLAAVTNANVNRCMVARVNGRVVDGVIVDKQVEDNRWVIWKGVTLADIEVLDKEFPRIGEKGKKKKSKD